MGYSLESRECQNGPVARAIMVPMEKSTSCQSKKVTTLETTKGEQHSCKPSSKIVYEPGIEETAPNSIENCDPPVTIMDCTAINGQALSRVARCFKENAEPGTRSCFETCVARDGSCPTAVGFLCPAEQSGSCQHSLVETKLDERGTETRMVVCAQDDHFCGCMESEPCANGPVARVTRRLPDVPEEKFNSQRKIQCNKESPLDCSGNYTGKSSADPLPMIERRNGLDPSEITPSNRFRRVRRRQVCPPHCCQPTDRPKSCSNSNDQPYRRLQPTSTSTPHSYQPRSKSCSNSYEHRQSLQTDCTDPKPFKCVLVPCTVSEKTDEGDRKSAAEPCENETIVPEVSSTELLTRYRDYVPPTMLFRYEACRAKRNGLQDQCTLPVPRAVLELKRKEARSRDEFEGIEATERGRGC
ncbi:unnamed protein product [Xylocopa violacea]|uniref:Uncharacterized protein n=1 Tax=Xylocopa violacea TaxID=135666 RepID=A0ABP1P0W0_XYLVO